jgi:hypothetical protein
MYEDANGNRGEMMARTVRFHEYGDASVLKIESLDVAPPGADEVQIDVKSIGLICKRLDFPAASGSRLRASSKRLAHPSPASRKAMLSVWFRQPT